MKHAKAYLCICTIVVCIGCKKEQTDTIEDYSAFLNQKQNIFLGTISDSSLVWRYGLYEFQRGYMSRPLGDTRKSLGFWLVSNKDLTTRISIIAPPWNLSSEEFFSKICSPGDKELGSAYEKFEMQLNVNNQFYTTNGDQTGSRLRVLKIEKTLDEFNRNIALVWFVVNCKFYNPNNNAVLNILDGKFLAGFMYDL